MKILLIFLTLWGAQAEPVRTEAQPKGGVSEDRDDRADQTLPLGVPVHKGPHSQCIEVNGQINGQNIHHPARLASVSKLVTSYWALKTLGADFRFTTRIGYNKTSESLYIDTQGDPLFAKRRLFYLISQLNQKEILSVKTVELLRGSIFLVFAEDRPFRFIEVGPGNGPSQRAMREHLLPILNTDQWTSEVRQEYKAFAREAKKRGLEVVDAPEFSAETVTWVNEERPTLWTTQSPPLIRYLKILNQFSLNYIGDRLYHMLGGKLELETFIAKDGDLNRDPYEFFTGSGLNIAQGFNRVDNAASCFFIIRVINKLREFLRQNDLKDGDLFLVVGLEEGTLNPGSGSPWHGRMLVKTGTLKNALTLAGILRTARGDLPFGLFYQTLDRSAARAERNRQVNRWFNAYGFGQKINYDNQPFFPIDTKLGTLRSRAHSRVLK